MLRSVRKVVDSNYLRTEDLRRYLASSPRHFAVLTDYAAMEAYKGNTLSSIYRSMAVLAEYPKQVIVLKSTQLACGVRPRFCRMSSLLVDKSQTKEFSQFCRHLDSARGGDVSLQNQLLALGKEADVQMARISADAPRLQEGFDAVTKIFTKAELMTIRSGEPLTSDILKKVGSATLLLSANLFRDHPETRNIPSAAALRQTFIFRYALCAVILALRWISVGGIHKARPEKVRNDMVDVNFAAYATYFDGLLTHDRKLLDIYFESRVFLSRMFGLQHLDPAD